MNIFYTDTSPIQSAWNLDDKRLKHMPKEYLEMDIAKFILDQCTNETELQQFLEKNGAKEINVQVAETGWWLGRYDREQKLYREEKGY
jgi:hypothetical protein